MLLGRYSEGDDGEVEEYLEVEDPDDNEPRRATSVTRARRQFISEEYAVKMKWVEQII